MTEFADSLYDALHGGWDNVFRGFDWSEYRLDLTGGEIYPEVEEVINLVKPTFVVEVGTWKGKSAIHMAKLLSKISDNFAVLCVDTWLGSIEHLLTQDPTWNIGPRQFGYPTLYHQFLANLCRTDTSSMIVPFPATSVTAAKWLSAGSVKPQLIYLDADHDEDEVYRDLRLLWPLLDEGGVIFGDDFDPMWYGVICAVSRFSREIGVDFLRMNHAKWLIQKPVIGNKNS